jgi:ribonucleotide reductase alpha subunit
MSKKLEISKKTLKNFNGDELATQVFNNKYALRNDKDEITEFSLGEMRNRMKNEMIKIDKNLDYEFLFKHFMPAGRILFALGNDSQKNSTLSNCYFVPIKGDSITDIYNAAKEQAILFSRGGGVGLDLSVLRPKGTKVNNSAKVTSGAVSFMDLFSNTTGLIGQAGRRGATIITIDISHPDVIDFIKVKGGKDKTKVQYANISVKFTNKFFRQLIEQPESDWEMFFELESGEKIIKYEKIKVIWNLFVESNYNGAEPGILFWDTINSNPASVFEETISKGVNPCFTGDTKVCLADGLGTIKTFNQLVYDDKGKDVDVYCLDDNEKLAIRTMRNPRKTRSNVNIWEITLDNGDKIKATLDHRFRKSNCEWVELQNLKPKDSLWSLSMYNAPLFSNKKSHDYRWVTNKRKNKSEHRVVSIKNLGYKEDVYCGTVDEFHNFFVGNLDEKTKAGKIKNRFVNCKNCGEQNLSNYSACNLGSLDLNSFVDDSFINPSFNKNSFIKATKEAVRFLNNINKINYSRQPLQGNKDALDLENKIGLGFTGMADMLIRMNLKYDTDEAIEFMRSIMKIFKNSSIEESIDLALVNGMCGILKKYEGTEKYNEFVNHPFFNDLSQIYKDKLKKYGIHNQQLQTIAPNGSISIILQTSSGIEPIFALSYDRLVKEAGQEKSFTIYHPIVKEYNDIFGDNAHLKNDNFIVSSKIDWKKRVRMQSVLNEYIDNSISSTINLPNDISKEVISDIYIEAWKQKLKGVTIYRAGSRDGILSEKKKNFGILESVKFPNEQKAIMKVIRSEGKKWYCTYTLDDDTKLPNSLFVNTNSTETNILTEDVLEHLEKLASKHIKDEFLEKLKFKHKNQANVVKISRTLSLLLRHRVPVINIVKTIDDIHPPVFSFVFQIKKLLSSFIEDGVYTGEKCPECGTQMIFESGCSICRNCGYSLCN